MFAYDAAAGHELLGTALSLCPGGMEENPEYMRGMLELIAYTHLPEDMDPPTMIEHLQDLAEFHTDYTKN